ncbi:MAG TPA: patatin-like phospholipase family protein, partial [Candidatus Eisenbacteria bacterium]|nr:patatin-like phospholipase family protein [Candidatus Eisenbacteria bacterium]
MASSQEANRHPVHKKSKRSKIDDPVTLDEVLKRERERLNKSREKRHVSPPVHEDNLIGLAFSGGGIRSATFNLGFLQALAQKGLLSKFDYLSTVSGGGYIGSWLAAFTKRYTDPTKDEWAQNEFSGVEKALSPGRYDPDQRSEPPVLHWLRLY